MLTLGTANTVGISGTLFLVVGTVFARSRKYSITIICSSKHRFSFLLSSALPSFRPQFLCTFALSMPCFSDIHISCSSLILLFPLSICLACINLISAYSGLCDDIRLSSNPSSVLFHFLFAWLYSSWATP